MICSSFGGTIGVAASLLILGVIMINSPKFPRKITVIVENSGIKNEINTNDDGGSSSCSEPRIPNCAIIYLCSNNRFQQNINSLRALFENFNKRFCYPVLIFHEDGFDINLAREQLNSLATQLSISAKLLNDLISFEKVTMQFPDGFLERHGSIDNLDFVPNDKGRFPGYHHMISFWAKRVFELKSIRKLEYFWRLDTDTTISSPITTDIFRTMSEGQKRYGTRAVIPEPIHVIPGLWNFTFTYAKEHNLPTNYMPPEAHFSADMPVYYNNFEVVHVPSFLSRKVMNFVKHFYDSDGIYKHRWGDHTLRWHTVHLFFEPKKDVHCFSNIAYHHQNEHLNVGDKCFRYVNWPFYVHQENVTEH